jgi:RNA polymerase subunit RPABC4/transcription elongation factor Spt4
MTASTGRSLGIAFLILIVLLLGIRLVPLFLIPLGIFPWVGRAIRGSVPDFSDTHFFPHWFPAWPFISFLSLAMLVLWIAVIVWVYRDAERRNMNGVLWALLVFFGNLIALLIYLIIRSDHPQSAAPPAASAPPATAPPASAQTAPAACPSCHKSVSGGYTYCPHCGAALRTVCPSCSKPVEKDWKACPYCGKKL